MAKYALAEVTFKAPLAAIGSSAWMVEIKQGGYKAAEYDTTDGMVSLIPGRAGLKRRRIHVSNTADLVYAPTAAKSEE